MQTKIVKGWGYPWPTSSGVYEGFGWGALHKDEEIIISLASWVGGYPPGNESISHQTGSSENHLERCLGRGYVGSLEVFFCYSHFSKTYTLPQT